MIAKSLERQIRSAVYEARLTDPAEHAFDTRLLVEQEPDDLPDDTLFLVNEGYTPTDPTCVYLEDTDGLLPFYATLNRMYKGVDISTDAAKAIADHETEHWLAFLAMSPDIETDDTVVGARFHQGDDGLMIIHPFLIHPNLLLPKLAIVALAAYPQADGGPSDGDLIRIRVYGYEGGVPEVAAHVAIWNSQPHNGAAPIPLPLTAQLVGQACTS